MALVLLAGPAWAQTDKALLSLTDTARLRRHMRFLTTTTQFRNADNPAVLDTVAVYLSQQLQASGGRVREQSYEVNGHVYRNIIADFGPTAGPIV